MPRLLTEDELRSEFDGGYIAPTERSGRGDLFGSAVDRFQAGLYGVGEALGSDFMGEQRRVNQAQSELAAEKYYADSGDPRTWDQVSGAGDVGRYGLNMLVSSSPELLTSLATGGAGALAGLGTAARLGLATAANYPSAVGDILQNQRAERGTTDLGYALPGGVPYVAADMLGLDAALASGRMAKTGIRALDNMQGARGLAARGFANTGMTALAEGSSETLQEVVNQGGRISVNPSQTLFNDEANERYAESFAGGALLGGMVSAPFSTGRSRQYRPVQENTDSGQQTDLLGGQQSQQVDISGNVRSDTMPLQQWLDTQYRPRPSQKNYAGVFDAAANEGSGQFTVDPETGIERELTNLELVNIRAGMEVPTAPVVQSTSAPVATQPTAPVTADTESPEVAARLAEWGVKPTKSSKTIAAMTLAEGFDSADTEPLSALVANNQFGKAKTMLGKMIAERDASANTQVPANAAAVQTGAPQTGQVGSVLAPAGAGIAPATAQQPVAQPQGPLAGIDPNKTVTVGRAGRQQEVSAGQLLDKIASASDVDKNRIMMAIGGEAVTDPTTGAPRIVITQEPRTLDEIAEAEAATTGKKVSRQAIQQSLRKFGITPEVINAVTGVSANTVSQEELGINPEENGSGYRVETELSKATGQGLVDDGNTMTKAQRAAAEQADALLAEAGPGTALATTNNAPTNVPEGATVTDLREGNANTQSENVRAILASAHAEQAALYWDHDTVAWADLPDTLKAEWVEDFVNNVRQHEGEPNEKQLAESEDRIGSDYQRFFAHKQPVRTIGSAAKSEPSAAGATGAGRSVPGLPSGAGSRQAEATDATVKVSPAESAWGALAEKYPMMPGWTKLSERQQKQVKDLVSREQFNLAAANTVAAGSTAVNEDVLNDNPDLPINADVIGDSQPRQSRDPNSGIPGEYSGPATLVEDVDAFLAENEGVRTAVGRLEAVGLGYAFEQVDAIYIAEDSAAFGADGSIYYDPNTKEIQLWLTRDTLAKPGLSKFTTLHELGHVVDGAFGGKLGLDKYSTDPRLGVSELLIPTGAVSRALDAEVDAETDIGETMKYPLETVQSRRSTSEEIFAQLFALSLVNNDVAAKLPAVAQRFIAEVIKDAKQNGEGHVREARRKAAQETRAGGSQSRFGKTASERSVSAQGAESGRGDRTAAGRTVKPTGVKSLDALPEVFGEFGTRVKEGWSWVSLRAMFTKDLLNKAVNSNLLPSAGDYGRIMDDITVERGKQERKLATIWQAFEKLSRSEKGVTEVSVNGVLKKSTMDKEWAFVPDWLPKGSVTVNQDSAVVKRYNALSPEAQKVVRDVFKNGHDNLQELRKTVLETITTEHDVAIGQARDAGDTKLVKKLEAKKLKQLSDTTALLQQRSSWPYAPLKRFGRFAVVAASRRFADLKDIADDENKSATERAAAQREMQGLQGDPAHYYVAFAESRARARAILADVAPQYDGYADFSERLDDDNMLTGGRDLLSAFQRLRNAAKDTADREGDVEGATTAKLDKLMRQLYLQLLSDTSVRKAEIERKGVAGADDDMMRAFVTNGRAQAHFVAGLKTNGKVNDLLRNMRNEARKWGEGRTERQDLFNEILRRHQSNLEYSDQPLIDKAMGATSVFMLLSNPSYYLLNATQPAMMSQPMLAASFGYGRSWDALLTSYKEMLPVLKGGAFREDDYSRLPADVRTAIEELANRGRIDIAMDSELGRAESDVDSKTRYFDVAVNKLREAAQTVESVNRLSTAIAAYRLAKGEMGHAGAVNYAERVILETHGDYSGFNAPRFMRKGVMRLATQFRKFQLIQVSMYARLLHDAFKGANDNQKKVARLVLAYNLTHLFAMGGLMGLPGFAAIAMLGKLIPSDEPDDPEATLRRLIGDKALADLLLKGVPKLAGVDVSGRIGAGGMLSLLPYTDVDFSRNGYNAVLAGAMGPLIGGLGPRMFDGYGLMLDGQYLKGFEQMLPGFISNGIKSYRYMTDGVTKRNGDVVLSNDEITAMSALFQLAGLPTNVISDRNFMASASYKSDTFYKERTSQIKRDYADAYMSGDGQALAELRQDWTAMQAARRELGYKPTPLSELLKSPQERRKRESQAVAGVGTTEKNAGFVRKLIEADQ